MLKPVARSIGILAAALAVAGCPLPTDVFGDGDLTVASLLTAGGSVHLVGLKAGGGGVAVPIAANRSAFVVFNSSSAAEDRLAVTIAPTASALAGRPFETRLRRFERARAYPRPPRAVRGPLAAPGYAVGDRESFWVMQDVDGQASSDARVTARVAYSGEHCYLFVDEQVGAGKLDERAQAIGKAFDQQIYPTDTRLFGAPLASGVNGDPKVTLLISPAVGNHGQDSTIGYFTMRDLFAPADDPANASLRRSNRRLMLYISSSVVSHGQAPDYLGTIAHEFQHLINASQKLFRPQGAGKPEDVWLDEGLAMYAMEANGYGLAGGGGVIFNHVAAYQALAPEYSLVNWDLDPEQSAYGAVYLFTSYLVDRFGEGLLAELVASSQVGLDNVRAALARRNTTFERVFDDWTAANLLDHTGLASDARYNYRGISMLGTYGGHRLRGLSLAPVSVPNTGTLALKPYSAQYFFVPRGAGGAYQFTLQGAGAGGFSGLVVAP